MIFNLDEARPHTVRRAICFDCLNEWVAVIQLETQNKILECPKGCGMRGKAFECFPEIKEANQ